MVEVPLQSRIHRYIRPCNLSPTDMRDIDEKIIQPDYIQAPQDQEDQPQQVIQGHSVGKLSKGRSITVSKGRLEYEVVERLAQDIAYGYDLGDFAGEEEKPTVMLLSAAEVIKGGRARIDDFPRGSIDELRTHLDESWDGVSKLGQIVGKGSKRVIRSIVRAKHVSHSSS